MRISAPTASACLVRGTNERRERDRAGEGRGRPVPKRHKAKPIAAGHSDGKSPPPEHCSGAAIPDSRDRPQTQEVWFRTCYTYVD